MRHLPLFGLALLVAATTACLDETSTSLEPQLAMSDAATGRSGAATYRVTVENRSGGQPFTPPIAALHRRPLGIFASGLPASAELQQVAENGNLDPMVATLSASKHVTDVVVTLGPTLPPVLPGEMVEFDLETAGGAKYLSVLSMLICTNDGFTGVSGQRLPRDIGSSTSIEVGGYDAGTEVNTEDFADLVPPCGPLTGVDSMGQGTGTSNPALAEGGVVTMHPGITGDSDLVSDIHGWSGTIATITIERIS